MKKFGQELTFPAVPPEQFDMGKLYLAAVQRANGIPPSPEMVDVTPSQDNKGLSDAIDW